jgi:hypothetical protein
MRAVRWLAKDESGMTMGLAVIMIVLIGVMGAGLLTFVQRDLEAVIEVNKGQRAFELADAGVQLAKQHIKRDPRPAHYDLDDALSPIICNIFWDNPLAVDETLDILPGGTPYVDGNWSPGGGGVTKSNLDGVPSTNDSLTVEIQWLNPGAGPTDGCKAPVASPPEDHYFYRVTSTGEYNGAKRKIEAIYETYPIGVPEAFFTTSNVVIEGTTTVHNTSVFTTHTGESRITRAAGFAGIDRAYGRWADTGIPADPLSHPNPYNPTPRSLTPLGTVPGAAGLGTPGYITGDKVWGRDYDQNTNLLYPNYPNRFVMPASRAGNQITFPFDPNKQPDLDELKAEAMRQEAETGNDHYREIADPTGTTSLSSWPPDIPGTTTVVYYKFTGRASTVSWDVNRNSSDTILLRDALGEVIESCNGPLSQGVIVVENGSFTTQPSKALFRGIVIIRHGLFLNEGDYTDTGGRSTCMEGYANADGTIKLAGNVSPGNVLDIINPLETAGFFRVRQWSWRECYSTTCT